MESSFGSFSLCLSTVMKITCHFHHFIFRFINIPERLSDFMSHFRGDDSTLIKVSGNLIQVIANVAKLTNKFFISGISAVISYLIMTFWLFRAFRTKSETVMSLALALSVRIAYSILFMRKCTSLVFARVASFLGLVIDNFLSLK